MDAFALLPKGKEFWKLLCVIFSITIVIRLILTFFKTLAVCQGEADYKDDTYSPPRVISYKGKSFRDVYTTLFANCGHDTHLDEYFLPSILGCIELFVYPLLMTKQGLGWSAIAFWIGVKTAGHWGMWGKSRTAYNRFLLGNILSLCGSYLIYYMFYLKN